MTKFSQRIQPWLFITPYIVGTFVLIVLPALVTSVIAFTDYNALRTPEFTGLDNFRQMWESPIVRASIRNTMVFVMVAVPLRMLGALGLALLLQRKRRLFGLYRAMVYIPTIIPETAFGLLGLWIFNPVFGPLNQFLGVIGLPQPAWLTSSAGAQTAIILLLTLQLGEGFIVLLAGLQMIPRAVYEAAAVDGASDWQSFWQITLPLLTPWMMLLLFRDLLMSVQMTFAPSYVMTYGGPYYATTYVPLLIYELAFDLFELGIAAALLLIFYLIIGLLVLVVVRVIGVERSYES